jgi:hypothetical protein
LGLLIAIEAVLQAQSASNYPGQKFKEKFIMRIKLFALPALVAVLALTLTGCPRDDRDHHPPPPDQRDHSHDHDHDHDHDNNTH